MYVFRLSFHIVLEDLEHGTLVILNILVDFDISISFLDLDKCGLLKMAVHTHTHRPLY